MIEPGIHAHDLPFEAAARGVVAATGDVGEGNLAAGLRGGLVYLNRRGRGAGRVVGGGDVAADQVAFRSASGSDDGVLLCENHCVPSPRGGGGGLHGASGLAALEGEFDVLGHRFLLLLGGLGVQVGGTKWNVTAAMRELTAAVRDMAAGTWNVLAGIQDRAAGTRDVLAPIVVS